MKICEARRCRRNLNLGAGQPFALPSIDECKNVLMEVEISKPKNAFLTSHKENLWIYFVHMYDFKRLCIFYYIKNLFFWHILVTKFYFKKAPIFFKRSLDFLTLCRN